jgi:hypothetical protein
LQDILIAIKTNLIRFKDRGFKINLKKDPENPEDDAPNTKIKTQISLEHLYTSKKFEGEKAYSRMMSILFLVLFFSSGIPSLYILAFIFYASTFAVNKVLLMKFYARSTSLTTTIPKSAHVMLKYGLLAHMVCGSFMLTNPTVLNLENPGDA